MLKRIFTIFLSLILVGFVYAQWPNPIVKRLSDKEITECKTPASIAYNFIEAILCRDFERMLSFADAEFAWDIIRMVNENHLTEDMFFVQNFSQQGGEKLNILGWIPALLRSYEVVIAYVQDEWYYEEDGEMYVHFEQVVRDGMIYLPGEDKPRVGINEKKVYVTCSPTAEVNHAGFQDITRYGDTNVKVLLKSVNGVWKVIGFK